MIRLLAALFASLSVVAALALMAAVGAFYHFGRGLPDFSQLAVYEPPITTRVYAGDGQLLTEYALEKRVYVPIAAIPRPVISAFLSAEDKNFYYHPGVDAFGIARAAITNLKNMGSDRRLVGASTITQQVAKNFLIGNEVSIERKIKEAILSLRIERTFSKDRILELYLNEIYLGRGSYGVAAAALNYFDRSLDELSIAEAAFLAALPKAPSNYDPVRHPQAALARRNWVLARMVEDGHIGDADAEKAQQSPITTRSRMESEAFAADYFAEEVRRELRDRYGERSLYEGGLVVRSTLDPRLQGIARTELRRGLEAYDRRHGWRGAIARVPPPKDSATAAEFRRLLAAVARPPDLGSWQLAVVLSASKNGARIALDDGTLGQIPVSEIRWARPWLEGQRVGRAVVSAADVLASGDVVAVEPVAADEQGKPYQERTHGLRQIPKVNGALVALDVHTGRVLAMVGGYAYLRSEFNRATQAKRQPGSAFKPFVYLTALEQGYAPTTLILDAPIEIDQGPGLPKWNPDNYTRTFYGPTTMRVGLEKSRNVMTVRLAQTIGIDRIGETAERFGIVDDMPPHLSYALGAGETTVLRLTAAFAMLVNGGKKIMPTLIDRIQDRHGRTIYRHDPRACDQCSGVSWRGQPVPSLPDGREAVTDAGSAYQIVSMLQGVVQRGTGTRVKAVDKPLAGKTGTTNDSKDTWFIGFTPDLAVGVFVGFDEPQSLGRDETGASAASPIFRDFMKEALAEQPGVPFRIPPGIRLVRVNAKSGELASPDDRDVIFEAFKPGSEPGTQGEVIGGLDATVDGPATGTGGLY